MYELTHLNNHNCTVLNIYTFTRLCIYTFSKPIFTHLRICMPTHSLIYTFTHVRIYSFRHLIKPLFTQKRPGDNTNKVDETNQLDQPTSWTNQPGGANKQLRRNHPALQTNTILIICANTLAHFKTFTYRCIY